MAVPNKMTAAPLEDRLAQLLAVLEARTKLLAFFFGLCFVAALLVLAVWFPQPTAFQYTVFRIVLALAAAGIAGVIPGMIRLKAQPGTALLIHAGGALAVFVMVYLLAPAALPQEQLAPPSPPQKEEKPAAQPLKISGVDAIENGVHILDFTPPLTRHTVRLSNIGEAPVHISLIGFPEKYFYINLADEKSLFQGHEDRDMSVILMLNVPEQQEYVFEVSDSAGGTARVAVRIKEGWKEYIAQQIQKIDDKLEQGASALELYNTAKQVIASSGYKELSAPLQEVFTAQLLEAAKQPEAAAMAYAKSKKESVDIAKRFANEKYPKTTIALSWLYNKGAREIAKRYWINNYININNKCNSCRSDNESEFKFCAARNLIECNDKLIHFFSHPSVEYAGCNFDQVEYTPKGIYIKYTFKWKNDKGEVYYNKFNFIFDNHGNIVSVDPLGGSNTVPSFLYSDFLLAGDFPDEIAKDILKGTKINRIQLEKMLTKYNAKDFLTLILQEKQKQIIFN